MYPRRVSAERNVSRVSRCGRLAWFADRRYDRAPEQSAATLVDTIESNGTRFAMRKRVVLSSSAGQDRSMALLAPRGPGTRSSGCSPVSRDSATASAFTACVERWWKRRRRRSTFLYLKSRSIQARRAPPRPRELHVPRADVLGDVAPEPRRILPTSASPWPPQSHYANTNLATLVKVARG